MDRTNPGIIGRHVGAEGGKEIQMRAFAIVAGVALGLVAASSASAGGYYGDPNYGYCYSAPYWWGPLCKPYAYKPVGYRYFAGTYDYVPFPNAPRHRFCRTLNVETPSGRHRRVRHCY